MNGVSASYVGSSLGTLRHRYDDLVEKYGGIRPAIVTIASMLDVPDVSREGLRPDVVKLLLEAAERLVPAADAGVLRAEDLDRHGVVFGLKSVKDGATELVTLYVGDDGWWHPKATVAAKWMPELLRVVRSKRWGPR
jgi:hypothetical protein